MISLSILSLCILLLDQLVKYVVRQYPVGSILFTLSDCFEIAYTVNTGAAFSIFSGKAIAIVAVSIVLLVSLYVFVFRSMNLTLPAKFAMHCLIGGALGNLVDRMFLNGVIDYIHLLFIDFPVFNIADIAITVSVFAMLLLLFTNRFERTS